jgi:hypothetical protein
MGLLKKLGLGPKDAAEAVGAVADKAADVVERFKGSERQDHEFARDNLADAAKATAEARAYDPRTSGTHKFSEWVNVIVDAINRMVRPVLAYTLMGSLFNWWSVTLNTGDPLMVTLALSVFGFYFGVRAVTEDLPKVIRALRALRSPK